jgi:hypothetical protein
MDCRNSLDRIPKMVEEEANTTLLEQEGERRGLKTWANMVRSPTVGGESCAPDVLCEVLVFQVTKKR